MIVIIFIFKQTFVNADTLALSILTCGMLCFAALFPVFYMLLKKQRLNSQFAIAEIELKEAYLKLEIKEEQTFKIQVEKKLALSDMRLQELEIIGKTKDLEQLYREKEELDLQVEEFRQKYDAFKHVIDETKQKNDVLQFVIVNELRRLFPRQMSGNNEVIKNLENLNKSFIDELKEKSDGVLSIPCLKYCVCFAIGMTMIEIADCFGLEPSSIYMIRYRLKKKFGLGNNDDLDTFLQKQNARSI